MFFNKKIAHTVVLLDVSTLKKSYVISKTLQINIFFLHKIPQKKGHVYFLENLGVQDSGAYNSCYKCSITIVFILFKERILTIYIFIYIRQKVYFFTVKIEKYENCFYILHHLKIRQVGRHVIADLNTSQQKT